MNRALGVMQAMSYYLRGPVVWDLLRGSRARILMYHGIPQRTEFQGLENYYGYNVPVRQFEQHLRYLKQHCNVVSLRDLLAARGLHRILTCR